LTHASSGLPSRFGVLGAILSTHHDDTNQTDSTVEGKER
jgi:hypothetical protein